MIVSLENLVELSWFWDIHELRYVCKNFDFRFVLTFSFESCILSWRMRQFFFGQFCVVDVVSPHWECKLHFKDWLYFNYLFHSVSISPSKKMTRKSECWHYLSIPKFFSSCALNSLTKFYSRRIFSHQFVSSAHNTAW